MLDADDAQSVLRLSVCVPVRSLRMLCRDVLQIDSRILLSRKIALVMRTVDPVVLQQAGVGIYHGLLGKRV
eukprot:COSAG02_NODE_110_length_36062_cov_85.812106_34_plen_71_part_00